MNINEQIEYIETNYSKQDIDSLSPKDRLFYLANIKEFEQPKRQRTSIDPNDNKLPDDIYTN